ncbi:MAG: NUDIX domain-containing protein [Armatimonadetes bacterium]|nr:NUDIX domain-containing protein [Armatimonadota bacterium]
MKTEQVLIVPRDKLFPSETPEGFFTRGREAILNAVAAFGEFRWRHTVEDDPSLKQIIPYALITCGPDIFLLRRHAAQTESRLHDKFSLGVGGHINPVEGMGGQALLEEGFLRELNEEVRLDTPYRYRLAGFLNEEYPPVSQVHFGAVYRVEAEEPRVSVAETEKMSGEFVSAEAVRRRYDAMETWSQRLVDRLDEVLSG